MIKISLFTFVCGTERILENEEGKWRSRLQMALYIIEMHDTSVRPELLFCTCSAGPITLINKQCGENDYFCKIAAALLYHYH